ncbi:MAG: hypothetical protein K6B75_02945 [Lachnospiraceae bacterium]|nr:hypothetical protein [Lachnospiraceae bacterium]
MLKGVYLGKKADGSNLYRASITHNLKHISLGSFPDEKTAHRAYLEAARLFKSKRPFEKLIESHSEERHLLSFEKWVSLINMRDNRMYIKTPIYLEKRSFLYFLDKNTHYRFDVDDLFYYSNHKIMKRGSHLFVADYGMQVSILSRYGIKSYAVMGRDYRFANGDPYDLRYANIEIINKYFGVFKESKNGTDIYVTKIHVNGDIIVGKYKSEAEAAVAYNRAADILKQKGVKKNFTSNFVEELSEIEYASLFNRVRISDKIRNY